MCVCVCVCVCVLIQVLLYDGVCNLCNGWVNFVIDRDPQSRYKFAALQGEAGRALMTRVGRGKLHAQRRRQTRAPEPASEFEKGREGRRERAQASESGMHVHRAREATENHPSTKRAGVTKAG